MKTSSADPRGHHNLNPDGDVRRAVFDRPLGSTLEGPLWGDPVIEDLVAAAVERGRAQGRAQGFAEGWAQGRQAAAEREVHETKVRAEADAARCRADAEQLQQVLSRLARAADALDRSMTPAWAELADVITDGALSIARSALARELSSLDESVVEAVRTALRTLGEPDEVVLRVNARDLAVIKALVDEPFPDRLRLTADGDVAPGDVIALTPVQRLHLSLPTALAAAEEVLRS